MLKKENGITLIALVVTIIVLLLIATITISGAIKGVDESRDNKMISELKTIQHAVVQRDTKYKLTKDSDILVGEQVNVQSLENTPVELTWQLSTSQIGTDVEKKYYRINTNGLKQLGLEAGSASETDTYIVNYYTGEVYNETNPKASNGVLLYITMQEASN